MLNPFGGNKTLGALPGEDRQEYYRSLPELPVPEFSREIKGIFQGDPNRRLYKERDRLWLYPKQAFCTCE
jgi:hypothetical protein